MLRSFSRTITRSHTNAAKHIGQTAVSQSNFTDLSAIKVEELVGNKFGSGNYYITKSAFGQMPVYIDYKKGEKVVTEIKNIKGDIVTFRNDLQNAFPDINKRKFFLRMESKKIIVEGNHKQEFTKFLQKIVQ